MNNKRPAAFWRLQLLSLRAPAVALFSRVEQRSAHQAHNLEVVGPNPTPAIGARMKDRTVVASGLQARRQAAHGPCAKRASECFGLGVRFFCYTGHLIEEVRRGRSGI